MLTLTKKEEKAFQKIMTRKGKDVDESGAYIGYYIQMKMFGVMSFRIVHSQGTWMKAKALFEDVGLSLDSLPDWTPLGNRIRGVKLYKKDVLGASRVWDYLIGIERRKDKEIGVFDLQPDVG